MTRRRCRPRREFPHEPVSSQVPTALQGRQAGSACRGCHARRLEVPTVCAPLQQRSLAARGRFPRPPHAKAYPWGGATPLMIFLEIIIRGRSDGWDELPVLVTVIYGDQGALDAARRNALFTG